MSPHWTYLKNVLKVFQARRFSIRRITPQLIVRNRIDADPDELARRAAQDPSNPQDEFGDEAEQLPQAELPQPLPVGPQGHIPPLSDTIRMFRPNDWQQRINFGVNYQIQWY